MSYANVMATLAVFIALGGGAYALTRGEVKSKHISRNAVKAKHIASNAVRAQELNLGAEGVPMLATFSDLDAGNNPGRNYHPVGPSSGTGLQQESISPSSFVATGLRVRVYGPVASGSREFIFSYFKPGGSEVRSALRCEVETGETDCQSNARVRVPEGADLWFEAVANGTAGTDYAEVGWRALYP